MDLEEIRHLLRAGHYEVSFHAQQERLEKAQAHNRIYADAAEMD